MKKVLISLLSIFIISMTFILNDAQAQVTFPTKNITIVVHPNPGGGSDILARQLANASQDLFKVPVIVENRVGGSGAVASTYVAKAAPDGYTLYCVTPTQLITPLLRNLPVTYKNFTLICRIHLDPSIIFVRKESPFKNIQDLIEHARKNPGKQNWSTGSAGSLDQMAAIIFQKETQTRIAAVPFESGGDARVAVMGGHMDAGIDELGGISPQLEAGQVRILATFNANRIEQIKDVPTLKELGYNVVVEKWRGIWGPRGIPNDVLQILQSTFKKAIEKPVFVSWIKNGGMVSAYMDGPDFTKFVETENERIKAFYKEIGLTK